jgi:predicted RNase H-like HicB family nuclease
MPAFFPAQDHHEFIIRGIAMQIQIYLEPSDEGGYTVIVPSLPGCISEGDTREEAIENITEAIKLYLEPIDDETWMIPHAEKLELAL